MSTAVVERPAPIRTQINKSYKEEFAEYKERCKVVGLDESPAIKMEQLKIFLAEKGIPTYNREQVHKWLSNKANEAHKGYLWCPLRTKDFDEHVIPMGVTTWFATLSSLGLVTKNVYNKLIPPSVVETVVTINEEFPDALFYVSDIRDVPDPFLAVTFPYCELLIVDFWDEPGFQPK